MHRVHQSRMRTRVTVLAAGIGLLLSACAGDDGSADAEPTDAEPTDVESTDVESTDAVTDDDPGEDASEPAGAAAEGDDLTVVATTSILGDIVDNLVGDDGEVTVLMAPGVDPHGYQPSAAEVALLREADLVVANGLLLEENLVSALQGAKEDGVRVLEVADRLDPIDFDADGHGHDEHDGHGHDEDDGHGHDEDDGQGHDEHDHGPEDPHVWFDPIRMADGVDLIASELAAVWQTIDADEWQGRADAYNEQLLAVHDEMEVLFTTIPVHDRRLVTNHDALGYLAHRYDFEVVGTVIPGSSTQAEADARAFAELIETVEDTGVPAIFAENTDSTVLAEQLASEVVGRSDLEVEVVGLYTDALGEDGSGAETYLDLLRTTAQLIADALA